MECTLKIFITMLRITGDINFTDGFFDTGFGVGSSIAKGADPFAKLNRNGSDFWIGNFECVCSDISDKEGIYRKQFIISPDKLPHIRHFNLYGVANNHVMQHGGRAYERMLDYLERNGCEYVGSKSRKSTVIEYQNKKIGIIAFSCRPENFSDAPLYWSMPEYSDIEMEMTALKDCDFRIIYVHWGNEFIDYPYGDQKHFAHFMIDKGADMIIGMHPHVLQGFEIYKDRYIFYSLGNFVFNMPWLPTKHAAVVNIDFETGHPEVSWDYIKIEDDFFPAYADESDVPKQFRFDYLNTLIANVEENERYYAKVFSCMKEYRKANYLNIIRDISKFRCSDLMQILADFAKRRL